MTLLEEPENCVEKNRLEKGRPAPEESAPLLVELCGSSTAMGKTVPPTSLIDTGDTDAGCWVARAVYGVNNPRWMIFREWLMSDAPVWFRRLYMRHGQGFAHWLARHEGVKSIIRRWMNARIQRMRIIPRDTAETNIQTP